MSPADSDKAEPKAVLPVQRAQVPADPQPARTAEPGPVKSAVRDLDFFYGDFQALKGVDLDITAGDFVAVMGASGSGKSTTMNILGCLDVPTEGQYLFRGHHIELLDRDQRALVRRKYLGFVFQGFNLLSRTSALENVELPLLYRGEPRAERRDQAMAALDKVGLKDWWDHTPAELSAWMRGEIARWQEVAKAANLKAN